MSLCTVMAANSFFLINASPSIEIFIFPLRGTVCAVAVAPGNLYRIKTKNLVGLPEACGRKAIPNPLRKSFCDFTQNPRFAAPGDLFLIIAEY